MTFTSSFCIFICLFVEISRISDIRTKICTVIHGIFLSSNFCNAKVRVSRKFNLKRVLTGNPYRLQIQFFGSNTQYKVRYGPFSHEYFSRKHAQTRKYSRKVLETSRKRDFRVPDTLKLIHYADANCYAFVRHPKARPTSSSGRNRQVPTPTTSTPMNRIGNAMTESTMPSSFSSPQEATATSLMMPHSTHAPNRTSINSYRN